MGWVPYDTKAGDLVSVLYGSSVPFVLRPYLPPALTKSNAAPENVRPRCFTLIGTSYLQGMSKYSLRYFKNCDTNSILQWMVS